MKKRFIAIALCAIASTACQQTPAAQAPIAAAVTAPAVSAAESEVTFELRDFEVEKSSAYGGSFWYKGRGTLVTKDPRLADGSFIVYVKYKREHDQNQESQTQIFFRDGLGTLNVSTYQTEEEEKTENVRFFDWSVIGYVPLKPAVIKADTVAATQPSPSI